MREKDPQTVAGLRWTGEIRIMTEAATLPRSFLRIHLELACEMHTLQVASVERD